MNITIIAGSPRTESVTKRIALHLQSKLKEKDEVNIHFLDISEIPALTFRTTWNVIEKVPLELHDKWKMMQNADAFILVTPEYNGSYAPSMKNWLDHFPKDTYYRKTMGIVTGSTGAMGGMRATQQMQQLICALFGIPCPHMLIVPFMDKKIDEMGGLLDPPFEGMVNRFVTEFLWQANQLAMVTRD